MKTERKTLKEQTELFPISSKTSKRILIALTIIYILFIFFKVYTKEQALKRVADVKWQYLSQVVYGTPPRAVMISAPRWNDSIEIMVIGDVTLEDKKTIGTTLSELKKLTGLNTGIRYHVGKFDQTEFPRFIKELYGPIKILFQDSSITKNDNWIPNAYAKYNFANFRTTYVDFNGTQNFIYKPVEAFLYIKTDQTTQKQRNNFILKGLANIFLCAQELPLKENSKTIYFNASGQKFYTFQNPLYNNFNTSVFNPKSEYCKELANIDKFILKTSYTNSPEVLRNKTNIMYFNNDTRFYKLEYGLLLITVFVLYFSGFFHGVFFHAIDNKISSKWLGFNVKFATIAIFSTALVFISQINSYYTSFQLPLAFNYVLKSLMFNSLILSSLITLWVAIPANLIYLIENSWVPKFEQFAKQQIFSFIALSFGIVLSAHLINIMTGFIFPHKKLDLLFAFSVGIITGIVRFFYNYSLYQRKLALLKKDQELNRLSELKTRAELDALQSKINPHFLYNALNSIAGLAHEDAAKTEHMALSLSKLFRYSINKENDDYATVKYEMDLVSIYLDIEKIRFGEKFQYILNMEKDLENELIPKFILQPLVENAIKHGISKVNADGMLKIEIFRKEGNLIMKVSDNGPAFPEDLMTGYGLHNIYEKLDILYPGKYEVVIQNGSNKNISVILSN